VTQKRVPRGAFARPRARARAIDTATRTREHTMFAAARSITSSALTKRVAKRDVRSRAEGESAPAPVAVRTREDARCGRRAIAIEARARDGGRGCVDVA